MKSFFAKLKSKMDFRNPDNVLKVTKLYKLWFIIPAAIIFLALVLGTVYQVLPNVDKFMNIGIDFQGGSLLTTEMDGADMINENYDRNLSIIESVLNDNGLTLSVAQKSGDNTIIVRYTNVVNGVSYSGEDKAEEMTEINNRVETQIREKFEQEYANTASLSVTTSVSMIGASASARLLRTAFLSVGIAILLILIYIIFRFDAFSGISAVVALLHDVLIMFAFTIIFRIQVNSSFVAAIITIVAYSINNTIIVFDRVRKNVKNNKKAGINVDPMEVANVSVTRTMTRSLFTTLTTMITVLCLVIFGVASIREFALPILFGLIGGFFSSVFIAPSLWALMKTKWEKRKNVKYGDNNIATDSDESNSSTGGSTGNSNKTKKKKKTVPQVRQSYKSKKRKNDAISYR